MADSTAGGGKSRSGARKSSSKASSKSGSKAQAKRAPAKKQTKPGASKASASKSNATSAKRKKPAATTKAKSSRNVKQTKKQTAVAKPAANQTSATETKGTRKPVTTSNTTTEKAAAKQAQQVANRKLWEAYGASRSEELREEIILQYAPLVKYVMGRLAISLPAVLDYEDILSFGTIGLIEAVERFDYEKGVKFETYAIARIRGAIIDALRSLDRLPRSVRQKAKDADKALVDLAEGLGRDPTDEEVAEAMGLTVQAYRKHLIDASWITVSLDTMGTSNDGDEDGGNGALGIADPDDEDFSVGLEQQELVGELAGAIRELPEREQLILSLYYKEELTMREVSKVLSISESRVCQLHARALTRLRGSIARMQEGRAA